MAMVTIVRPAFGLPTIMEETEMPTLGLSFSTIRGIGYVLCTVGAGAPGVGSYSNKTSSAIGTGLDTAQRRVEPSGSGESNSVSIQPSANPANRKVTAVGRSY